MIKLSEKIASSNPEWVFGELDFPEEQLWYCSLYETFREVEILGGNFSKYWASNPPIPKNRDELYSTANKYRHLIGDLNDAAFLFLLADFPKTPWLSLGASSINHLLSIYPEQLNLFPLNNDPVYVYPICRVEDDLTCELLIDWRRSNSDIIESFMEKRRELLSNAEVCFHGAVTDGAGLGSYNAHEAMLQIPRSTRSLRAWLKQWVTEERVRIAVSVRDVHKARIKRLAILRLKRILEGRALDVNEHILHRHSGYLYANSKSYYDALKRAEDDIQQTSNSFSLVSCREAMRDASASAVLSLLMK